jgi:hypothetical protein
MIRPKHTYQDVAKELAEGLEAGTVVLGDLDATTKVTYKYDHIKHKSSSKILKMVGLIETISIYGSVCLSSGGLAVLIGNALHLDYMIWFPAGFALPIGPLYLYFTSDRVMEARLERWKRWKENDLIEVREYEQLRRDALIWFKYQHGFSHPLPPADAFEPTSKSSP